MLDRTYTFRIHDAKFKEPIRYRTEATNIDEAFEFAAIAADVNRYFNVTKIECIRVDGKAANIVRDFTKKA